VQEIFEGGCCSFDVLQLRRGVTTCPAVYRCEITSGVLLLLLLPHLLPFPQLE
jgi:hypothetical protein